MAKKIIRLPGRMSRLILRLVGAVFTFLFTFFVYASGQFIQATGAGKTTATKISDVKAVIDSVGPLYGVILYGPPPAQLTIIKGIIKSLADSTPVEKAKVILQDTASKQIIDSTFTATNGSFSMTFYQMPGLTTWLFEARDTLFVDKDTLISIPSGDTVNIELYLKKISTVINPAGPGVSQALPAMRAWYGGNGTIETRYMLPVQGQTRMALYGANGKLTREFFDRSESAGEHEAHVGISGLPAGIYFLKLQTDAHVAITKISIDQ